MHTNDDVSGYESSPEDSLDDLIQLIIEEPENETAWNEFRSLASRSSEPWLRLAQQQRLARQLGIEFADAVAPAMNVELPLRQAITMDEPGHWHGLYRSYVGWAAAILVALGWLMNSSISGSGSGPSMVAKAAAKDGALLDQYLAQPHVLGELPARLYEVEQGQDGQIITIVRQIIERHHMKRFDLVVEDGVNPVLRPSTSDSEQLATRF
jgi:hypothetical protein